MTVQDHRIARLQSAAKDAGYDCLVASCKENLAYLSGGYISVAQSVSASTQIYALLSVESGRVSYVCSVAEVPHLLEFVGEEAMVYAYGPFHFDFEKKQDSFVKSVAAIIDRRHKTGEEALSAAVQAAGTKPGFDETHISFALADSIAKKLSIPNLSPAASVFREARRIKHQDEIDGLRESALIAEASFLEALECATPGISEKDLEMSYRLAVARRGAIPYFFVATAAKRSAFVDAVNTSLVINDGDVIRFDFGCIYNGYYSDLARTAVMGEPSKEVEFAYSAVVAGADAAFEKIKPGVTADELFHLQVEATRAAGLSDYQRSHCGHGIGLEGYDVPSIAAGNMDKLQEGMVLCIETPYYRLGFGGVQIEHTIAVTEDGFDFLDSGDSSLIVITP